MIQINLQLLAAGGILLILVGTSIGSRTAKKTGAADSPATAAEQTHPEVPKADPVDWDRDPHPTNTSETTPTKPTSPTPSDSTEDSPESEQTDSTDLSFGWEFDTDHSFTDVGGMDQVKDELRRDTIHPLGADSELIDAMGISVQNVLFHGPPGTGKTYLARALAGELDVPFVHLSGAAVQSKWINESAAKVNALFSEASQVAAHHGGAVVFIDELDTVLSSRTTGETAHAEDSKVVNEFLSHLEHTKDNNVVFIGATNRERTLDEAAVRTGRLDKHIEIGLPEQAAREAILAAQLDARPHEVSEANVAHAARQLDGVSAADITGVVDAAARLAVIGRAGDKIRWGDVQMAIEEFASKRRQGVQR